MILYVMPHAAQAQAYTKTGYPASNKLASKISRCAQMSTIFSVLDSSLCGDDNPEEENDGQQIIPNGDLHSDGQVPAFKL